MKPRLRRVRTLPPRLASLEGEAPLAGERHNHIKEWMAEEHPRCSGGRPGMPGNLISPSSIAGVSAVPLRQMRRQGLGWVGVIVLSPVWPLRSSTGRMIPNRVSECSILENPIGRIPRNQLVDVCGFERDVGRIGSAAEAERGQLIAFARDVVA